MNKYISAIYLTTLSLFTTVVSAQNRLPEKDSVRVDLGFGIEQTLTTTSASVWMITHEELKQTAAINLSDALYGRLLGLTALKNSGFAGDENYGASFNIRGYQTLSDNTMLILVDGVKRPIDRLTINEVESVTILKDAAATALLGYQGINGAILVKTKRGEEGKVKIDVSYDHKFTFSPVIPGFVDGYTYANALNEARSNDGLTAVYSDPELELLKNGTDPYFYPNVNWKDEMLKNTGSEDQLNLAVHGGNDKVKYFTMLDYTGSRGILKDTEQPDFNTQLKYSKANVRANLDFAVTPTTDMTVNMLASFIETNRPAGGGANDLIYRIYQLPSSAFPVRTPDGIWGGTQDYTDANPVARIRDTGYEKTHQRGFYTDARLTQQLGFLVDGLSLSARLAYNNYSAIHEQHTKSFQYGYLSYAGEIGDKNNVNSIINGDKINNIEYNHWMGAHWYSMDFALSLDYRKTIHAHTLSSSLIYNSKSETDKGRHNTFNRINLMAYIHYDWKQRLIADLVLAGNGSNRSYPEKWAFSPTLSLAYIFRNNPDASVLNFGKIRTSMGIQHSDYVPISGIWLENYDGSHGNIVFKSYYDSNNWGSALTHYPLTKFSLETAYKYNAGIDLRLFGSVDITAEAFYNRRTNIMLQANNLNSWVVGRPDSYATEGKVENYGIEAGVNYAKQLTTDFRLNAGAFFTWGTNRILNYIEIPNEEYQSRIGQRIDQPYGLETIGFFKNYEEIANSPEQQFSQVRPGDIRYKDRNNDGAINENDAVYFGYGQTIPETNYSFTLGAQYKRVGFNLVFQGVTGLTKYLGTTGVWYTMINNNNLSGHYLENCWRPGDPENENILYPRLTTQENPNNYQGNTTWYKNISWLKLRNAEIYYRLPENWLNRMYISNAKIYVKGENLLTLSNLKEMDPEALDTYYPTMKGINIGISLNF